MGAQGKKEGTLIAVETKASSMIPASVTAAWPQLTKHELDQLGDLLRADQVW